MASSYPLRLFKDGKPHIQIKSMNHYCFLSKFETMKEYIGEDVWDELKNSYVGVFLKLTDINVTHKYIWVSSIVNFFLSHQLAVDNIHEFWSLIDGQPLRFLLHEFKDITSLNCDPFPSEASELCDVDYKPFWKEMKVPLGEGPSWVVLVKVLKRCQKWDKEKRKMLGRLCILHVGVYGINHGSRISLSSARRVFDTDRFDKYPWGRAGFTSLVNSVKVGHNEGSTYQLNGCVHVLLIWIFESVHTLGELYGSRRDWIDVPPLLNWKGCRQHFRFEDLIANEKAEHG
ncbi:hypothetical protein V5N11_028025 [Cardamine amara subsp. amara]|uniref:DUF1985 domain-containing protein n=1 Tax=Cardamine amara subsp. amara TaxID=228776 RepID=A0ABD1AKK5_CARAN